MNTFSTSILIRNTVVQYTISKKGELYRAILTQPDSPAHLPLQLSFWKDNGQWRTNQMVNEHVLYQFGYHIDNKILSDSIAELKLFAA
jgi:hypothetical protein